MAFQIPPKCEACRLVATSKVGSEVYLSVLHYEEGFIYFGLSELEEQRQDIRSYIMDLLPEILAGNYQVELVNMEEEEIY